MGTKTLKANTEQITNAIEYWMTFIDKFIEDPSQGGSNGLLAAMENVRTLNSFLASGDTVLVKASDEPSRAKAQREASKAAFEAGYKEGYEKERARLEAQKEAPPTV